MKINELRVGNLILSPDTNKPVIVELNHLKAIQDGVKFNNKTYKPIPLTPEILEKAGFKHDETDDSYFIPEKADGALRFEIMYWGSMNGSQKGYMLQNGYGSFVYNHGHLYLHELQNLYFFVTGTELEINLNP